MLRAKTDNPRTHLFLDIAEKVYNYYQKQLSAQNRIDFEDMINDAHFYLGEIERQQLEIPYKYIIIRQRGTVLLSFKTREPSPCLYGKRLILFLLNISIF